MAKSNRIVQREFDSDHLPPLDRNQKAELEALRQSDETEIDYSDIPSLGHDFWVNAIRTGFRQNGQT